MSKSLFLLLPLALGLASCAPAAQKAATAPAPAPQVTIIKTPPVVTSAASAVAPVAAMPGFVQVAPLSAGRVNSFDKAPAQIIDPGKTYRAVLNTTKGSMTVELNSKAAPVAVNNFVFLALNHFYDGTRFHRVIDGFMAQGGDPLSTDLSKKDLWGTGGPGYNFMAENRNGLKFDNAGVLGMARSSSLDSQGSQFFITVAPADFLDGEYTVFGKVVAGGPVLNLLTRTMTGNNADIPGAVADTLNSVTILVSQ